MKSRDGKSQREEKSRKEKSRREKSRRERRSEKRKSQKKEDAGAPKGRKVAKHCVFPMFCGSGGSKSRLAKAKIAPRCGAKHISSQNVKNTRGSDHFWTLRCRFAWQAQGIVHLVKSEQNVKVL